jgi:hypothetical protein
MQFDKLWSCDKGGGLFLSQKLHRAPLVAFRRDRKDALALQGEGWFTDRYILEEGMDCSCFSLVVVVVTV